MLDKRIEIAIALQQLVPVQDAPRRNQRVNGTPYSNTPHAQAAEIPGCNDGDLRSSRHQNVDWGKEREHVAEVSIRAGSLKHLG